MNMYHENKNMETSKIQPKKKHQWQKKIRNVS